jgi:hypothetical protein
MVNIAAAVRTRIECLAATQKLEELGERVLKDFGDVFTPIPHVDDLPTDVYCKIKLKDASHTIKTCPYSMLRKYQDTWKILIKQHLDAGCICPSNSPHASPAFLIPKSDPNVLPRWVNDY